MAEKRSPEMIAVEAVHSALLPLDADNRKRVLRSVYALLNIDMGDTGISLVPTNNIESRVNTAIQVGTDRPVSIRELIDEKQPGTSAQRIVLFAYYREKYEGQARFSRKEIEPYFSKAKLTPAANFDRDFVETVKKGWIHEDGENSYITSKGIESVEAGFVGERKYPKGTRKTVAKARRKSKSKKR